MKKLLLIVLLFGLILFTACGKTKEQDPEEPIADDETEEITEDEEDSTADEQSDPQEDQTKNSTDNTDGVDGSKDKDESTSKNNDSKNDNANTEMIKTGYYNGQADPHTIEVETDEGPVAYQLTMEARDLVVDLEPGDEVTYTYYKDGEMLVIKHIEKSD